MGSSQVVVEPVIFGLGANLGSARATLQAAIPRLAEVLGSAGWEVAGLYETAPIGPQQPDFLNSAVLLHTPLSPLDILRQAQRVEVQFGRQRGERWGPRTLDIDVLWSTFQHRDSELIVPHPALATRAFAALPFLELWGTLAERFGYPPPPSLFDSESVSERSGQRILRIAGPEWASS